MAVIAELKRRNVFRVAAAYAVVAWLLVEVASVVLPTFEAPGWVMKVLTFLLILGFPAALVLAWAFELTPQGIKRETAVDPKESIARETGRKLDFAIIGLLALAVVYFAVDKFALRDAAPIPDGAPAEVRGAHQGSIAVLPFANRSANEADAYFVDGMHDDILTHLAKIRSIKVISRTSVMDYRNTTKNLRTVGRELGAATILEGGVQRSGTQVRINVQLIDAETDEHLWADIYDRQLTAANVFSIQTEIATAIAEALRATLTTEERELLDTVPTENMAALEAYFLGKQHMAKRNVAALAGAIDDFKRAVELDPNFALAYVGLADGYILQVEYSGFPIEEVDAKARPAVERALALDDRLAEAYTSLGGLEDSLNHHEAAEAAFRRALELNPNYVTAYHWYSILLAGPLGRPAEALELIQRAVELDPRSPIILQNVGNCYAGVGRFEESLAWYRNAIEVDPDFPGGHQWIGDHYWRVAGRLDEAARWLRKAVALDPEAAERAATLGLLFLDLGDRDRAEYWIERSLELAPDSFSVNLAMELLRLQQGDRPAALEYGRRAFPSQINYYSFWFNSFRPMRIDELRAGRYREARAAVEKIAPELLNEASPQIGVTNYRAAIDLALILSKTGDPQRADWLLEHSLQYIQGVPRLDSTGYGVADAQIYAVQGNPQQALSALRRAIDEGWRAYWWFYLEYDPILEPLHGEPAYQAMVAEIEADMAAQLAHLREMERNGEVEAYAGVSAAMQ